MNHSLFIVVIDDSPTVCTILDVFLTREGHQVKSFQNPVPALRSILKTGETPLPDLLFIDLSLPMINGYEVIRLFKNNPASIHIPVIVISRLGDTITRLKVRLCRSKCVSGETFPDPGCDCARPERCQASKIRYPRTLIIPGKNKPRLWRGRVCEAC